MNKFVFLTIFLILSTTSFADQSPKRKPAQSKCDSTVTQYAQSIIDISGKALQFNGGSVQSVKQQSDGSYLVSAAIYKGSYDLKISVDSSCVFLNASLNSTGD